MKSLISIFTICLIPFTSFGQSTPSSCDASDSIVALYNEDAARLVLRSIYELETSNMDSVEIPQAPIDTILYALIAVYNANDLPARDTVIEMFDIHTFPMPSVTSVTLAVDSNIFWIQQLGNGVIPTGNSEVDDIMSQYNLSVSNYYDWGGNFPYYSVSLTSSDFFNIQAMANNFAQLEGVIYSHPEIIYGDGNDIEATINPNYIEFIFSHGWGDCPSGCKAKRYWKFNVYYDCSVEFVESYGNTLLITSIRDNAKTSGIVIYPNPFKSSLNIEGADSGFDYILYDINGRELMRGQSVNEHLQGLDKLSSGPYFLQLTIKGQISNHRLIKK